MVRLRRMKKGEPPLNTRSCKSCNELDTQEMVQCDICDNFFHFVCVDVDSTISERDWACKACNDRSKSKVPPPFTPMNVLSKSPVKKSPAAQTSTAMSSKSTKTAQAGLPQIPQSLEHAKTTKDLKETMAKLEQVNQAYEEQRQKHEREMAELKALLEQHQSSVAKTNEAEKLARMQAEDEARRAEDAARRAEDENVQLRQQLEEAQRRRQNVLTMDTVEEGESLETASEILFEQRTRDASGEERFRSNQGDLQMNPQSADILYETMKAMLQRLIAESTGSQSVSAPIQSRSTQSNGNVFDEAFSSHSGQQAETSVDRLTNTMRRQYLPKLPTFSGNIKEWAAFEHIYNETTIQGMFSPADNVARLREALKPPASQLVLSLILYSSDADRIMEELKDAYGKPEDLIATSLDELFALPCLNSQVDSGLRNMMILVRNYVANLDNLKAHTEIAGVYALRKIVPKLHHQHQTEWHALKRAKPTADLREFSDFLVEKVKQIPNALLSMNVRSVQTNARTHHSDQRPRRLNMHQQASSTSAPPEGCLKCSGGHELVECPEYLKLSTNSRWDVIKRQQICSACLQSTSHRAIDCQLKRTCGVNGCDKIHNRTLHNYRSQSNSRAENNAWRSQQSATSV